MASFSNMFYIYSSCLLINPIGCLVLVILQLLSIRYAQSKKTAVGDGKTKALVFLEYIFSSLCGFIGFSLHMNSTNRLWCNVLGLPFCFVMYGTAKSLVYLFFFRRAKLANGSYMDTYLKVFLKYIAPTYLFIYWIFFCVGSAFIFAGKINNNKQKDILSFCVWGKWQLWFLFLGASVEIVNFVVSLLLFLYPLIKSMRDLKKNGENVKQIDLGNYNKQINFISVMKWNVGLSFIAILSSCVALWMIPFAKQFMWIFCLGDPFINSLCIFFMIASNRTYMSELCCWCTRTCTNDTDPELNTMPSGSVKSVEMTV